LVKDVLKRVKNREDVEKIGGSILTKLRNTNKKNRTLRGVFESDPSQFPRYTDIVKKPMYYAKIAQKLKSGQYRQLATLYNDVGQIFTSAMFFNVEDSVVYIFARDMLAGGLAKKVQAILEKPFWRS